MSSLLQKLVENDTELVKYTTDKQTIQQGLAPLVAQYQENASTSLTITKAYLLEQVKFHNWQTKAKQLFNALDKKHINYLVFKGFAYTFLIYQQKDIRPYSDIDVVLDKKDYGKVESILKQLGYKCFPSRQGEFVSFQNSFYIDENPNTTIDLHWQINNRIEFHQHFPFAELYKNSVQIQAKEYQFKTLNQYDGFIVACFHYQAHRREHRKHIWLYDLALLWQSMDKTTKQFCLNKAKETQQSKIVINTLARIDRVFKSCLSIDAETRNKFATESYEATEDYLHSRKKKITDIKTRLKNIKGFKNKVKYLSEYILQDKTYVQNRFNLKTSTWVFLYYPKMWLQDISKLFK